MNINGTTVVLVNNHSTRVLGRHFNKALKKNALLVVTDLDGQVITPSKGLSWLEVAAQIRAGKSVQAASGTPRKRAVKASAKLAA